MSAQPWSFYETLRQLGIGFAQKEVRQMSTRAEEIAESLGGIPEAPTSVHAIKTNFDAYYPPLANGTN